MDFVWCRIFLQDFAHITLKIGFFNIFYSNCWQCGNANFFFNLFYDLTSSLLQPEFKIRDQLRRYRKLKSGIKILCSEKIGETNG